MRISLIAAMADNGVIGNRNTLPWRLPDDMKWFRRHTIGKPVIMGRRTFESIGRPLPQRHNIVLTGDPAHRVPGCTVVTSLEGAVDAAGTAGEVMVMGGASVYRQCLDRSDRLYLTLVHADVAGDAHFPDLDWSRWKEVERTERPADAENPYPHTFLILERP